jgi:hypothetical protein
MKSHAAGLDCLFQSLNPAAMESLENVLTVSSDISSRLVP